MFSLFLLESGFSIFVLLKLVLNLLDVVFINTIKYDYIKFDFTNDIKYFFESDFILTSFGVLIGHHKRFQLLVELFVIDARLFRDFIIELAQLYFE